MHQCFILYPLQPWRKWDYLHQLCLSLVPVFSHHLHLLRLCDYKLPLLHFQHHLHSLPGHLHPTQPYQLLMFFNPVSQYHLHLVFNCHQQLRFLLRCVNLHGLCCHLHAAVAHQLRMQ